MTGFARADGTFDGVSWAWEARSVNGKALDVRVRTSQGFDHLDAIARTRVAAALKRGSVTVTLQVRQAEATGALRLNRALLDQVLAVARELDAAGAERPRLDALLSVRGVIETVDAMDQVDPAALTDDMTRDLDAAIAGLLQARQEEGARIGPVLGAQMTAIADLVAEARRQGEAQPAEIAARLRAQLADLLADVSLPEERLAQEVALLAGKADVREELDRLDAHVAQARALMAEGGPVGRRLDFLCQEFNREANTLCSKSTTIALTRCGLELKAQIEQFREQVQNIE